MADIGHWNLIFLYKRHSQNMALILDTYSKPILPGASGFCHSVFQTPAQARNSDI